MDEFWQRVLLIWTIIAGIASVIQLAIWIRRLIKAKKFEWRKIWIGIIRSPLFWVFVALLLALVVVRGCDQCPNERVLSCRDFYLDDVTIDKELDKAIIYGSMSTRSICVPRGKTRLIVEITIPSNGWGEGLAGLHGSAAQIEVDSQVKAERIADDMNHHHGWYYKYEYGDRFSNTFDVTGKEKIVLTIRMVGGVHLDFKQAKLVFQ